MKPPQIFAIKKERIVWTSAQVGQMVQKGANIWINIIYIFF